VHVAVFSTAFIAMVSAWFWALAPEHAYACARGRLMPYKNLMAITRA